MLNNNIRRSWFALRSEQIHTILRTSSGWRCSSVLHVLYVPYVQKWTCVLSSNALQTVRNNSQKWQCYVYAVRARANSSHTVRVRIQLAAYRLLFILMCFFVNFNLKNYSTVLDRQIGYSTTCKSLHHRWWPHRVWKA